MDATKNTELTGPECMRMKLPFSDVYLAETKLRILRKKLQEYDFNESDCLLIMKKRRLLRCKRYVREYRKREKNRIEMLEKEKVELCLEKYVLNFHIENTLRAIQRIEMSLAPEI